MIDTERRRRIQSRLLTWYREGHRDLPWRATRDPYRILVSEIMLQQTQAVRVIQKYHAFLERFPTSQALAAAPTSDVIRAWAGLGYNRRALNLQRASREVVARHGGVMPRDVATLLTLPGVGPYTAGAIACFAHDEDVSFVDTNIRRVLCRVARGPEQLANALTPLETREVARELLPPGEGHTWHQALMELGATLCRARSVACERCPLHDDCRARPVMHAVLGDLPKRRFPHAERFEQTSRYARGRIVDALRRASDAGLTVEQIGRELKVNFSDDDRPWIEGRLRGLVVDGLVVVVSPVAQLREDSSSYDGEPSTEPAVCVRYALPS
ncbi:MAG TPA: A/G-specific adenine glycosylase [Thermomicrobiales bacterium]|nr:A/G-specific adenine glycosylase [Thermomicrobiales bacterium]